MTNSAPPLNAAQIADQLQQDRQQIPWIARRRLVKVVAEELKRSGPSDMLIHLLERLADDPKWEVRVDVADCLLLLNEHEFARLAARLVEDDSIFVRQAVQQAMDRRRRGRETTQSKRRGLDHVQAQYHQIEKVHGSLAAQRAQALAEQLYDILVGATVHDMRNFLAPLKSAISALQGHLRDGQLNPRLFESHLAKMSRQAAMIERMLEDMRTYSQPTPAQRRRERLAGIIQQAHDAVLDSFRATNRDPSCIATEINVPADLTVQVSRCDIVRAMMNLIANAYEAHIAIPGHFSPGSIWITASQCDPDHVEIIFCDNGMGISPEELAEVRRFVPGGTSKKKYGTGFGLPTAKRKIEAHGGSLAIDAIEDQGATVTVTLPMNSEEGSPCEIPCPGD